MIPELVLVRPEICELVFIYEFLIISQDFLVVRIIFELLCETCYLNTRLFLSILRCFLKEPVHDSKVILTIWVEPIDELSLLIGKFIPTRVLEILKILSLLFIRDFEFKK